MKRLILLLCALIWSGAVLAQEPPSLDGFLVFVGSSDEQTDNRQLFLHDFATGDTTQLTDLDEAPRFPVFSPSCEDILYLTGNILEDTQIYRVSADAETIQRIDNGDVSTRGAINWSPNGQFIAYREGQELLVYDLDSEDYLLIDDRIRINSAWSPDSSQIAYFNRDEGLVIYSFESDSYEVLDLDLGRQIEVSQLTWSPSGDYLTFNTLDLTVDDPNIASTALLMDIEANEQSIIAQSFAITQLEWDTTGESLIYSAFKMIEGEQTPYITRYDLASETYTSLGNDTLFVQIQLAWETDDTFLAAGIQAGLPNFVAYMIATDEASEPVVLEIEGYRIGEYDWCVSSDTE